MDKKTHATYIVEVEGDCRAEEVQGSLVSRRPLGSHSSNNPCSLSSDELLFLLLYEEKDPNPGRSIYFDAEGNCSLSEACNGLLDDNAIEKLNVSRSRSPISSVCCRPNRI